MKWSEKADFGFAVGRVRALEPQLLDRTRYERLISAANAQELATLILDAGYHRYNTQGDSFRVEHLLRAAQWDNATFIAHFCQVPTTLALFFLRENLNRVKTAVKKTLRGRSDEDSAESVWAGTWSKQQIELLIAGNPTAQPEEVRVAVGKILSSREAVTPDAVDVILDTAGQRYLNRLVERAPFERALTELRTDLLNVLTTVRSHALGEPAKASEASFVPGGRLSLARILAARATDWDGLVSAFRDTAYGEIVAAGVGFFRERRSMLRLERLAREEELRFLHQTRYIALGYEPLLAFCLQVEAEVTNLRLLHAAKLAGAPAELCREAVACVN